MRWLRTPVIAALVGLGVGCCGLGGALAAQAKKPAQPTPPPAEPLTLENAKPAAVPGTPRLNVPKAPPAPVSFAAPAVVEAPPPPVIPPVQAEPLPALTVETPALPAKFDTTPKAPPPTTEPVKPATQVATTPPPDTGRIVAAPLPDGPLSLEFSGDSTDLSKPAETVLATLAVRMQANPALRLQLRSYAKGSSDDERDARRLSQVRALAVRNRLVSYGIRSTRIDVRPLGTASEQNAGGKPDRIDIDVLNN